GSAGSIPAFASFHTSAFSSVRLGRDSRQEKRTAEKTARVCFTLFGTARFPTRRCPESSGASQFFARRQLGYRIGSAEDDSGRRAPGLGRGRNGRYLGSAALSLSSRKTSPHL